MLILRQDQIHPVLMKAEDHLVAEEEEDNFYF
jgi:hypothetical protein